MGVRERWNVLVSVREGGFRRAVEELRPYGTVHKTPFYNVLVVNADNPEGLLDELKAEQENNPAALDWLGHIAVARDGFLFQTPEEFEHKAREHLRPLVHELAGKRFFVRMHRRGFKERLSSQREEQQLDRFILDTLREEGEAAAAIDFEDPDVIVDIQTLAQEAGIALWSRQQRARYPFLKLH